MDAQLRLNVFKLFADFFVQFRTAAQHPIREAQANDRVLPAPIPVALRMQPCEQFFIALKKFLERIEEEALAEPSRSREEVVATFFNEIESEGGFVDIVAPSLADLRERLNPDWQFEALHGEDHRRNPRLRQRGEIAEGDHD